MNYLQIRDYKKNETRIDSTIYFSPSMLRRCLKVDIIHIKASLPIEQKKKESTVNNNNSPYQKKKNNNPNSQLNSFHKITILY